MKQAVEAAIAGLHEAVSTPPERNDLGRLARMHSWGQSLIEAASPTGGAVVSAVVGQMATSLVLLLERLILDEAANPELGIALVAEAACLIEQAHQGRSVAAESLITRIREAVDGPAAGAAAPVAPPAPPATAPAPTPSSSAPVNVAPPPHPASVPAPTPTSAVPARPAPAPVAESKPADEAYVSEPLTLDLSEREHLEGFLDESNEHMDAIEAGLLALETDPTDTTKIDELFRPFHTIKGIAGFLNLRDINRLTHEIETMLDLGRKNELRITAGTVDLIFASVDVLKAQLDAIRRYMAAPTGGPCPQPEISAMMRQLRRAVQPGAAAPAPTPARPMLGELLVAEGAATASQVHAALRTQEQDTPPQRKLGEVLVDEGAACAGDVERALSQQSAGKPVMDHSIRVDTHKLDVLVDAVGELVIAQSMVCLAEAVTGDEKLHRNVSQVTKIVRDVQETAMAMRMVPIGHTFQKMRRLVRDVARKANKQVELVINGEETELDKNVIQQMSDPLVHMVRNAVDHGVEAVADRMAAGKPEVGKVMLNAYHQGDSIVIEIRDDGRGLDPQKLIAKGIERGLITADDQLSEQQAFALILQPGFSTAETITDISGRGVGMDVVRRNVEQLRGKIEIQSEKGRGSVFFIRLPLTLAIIDGMLVRVGDERMIIPTILIEQSLRPEPKQITSVQRRGAMLQVRGELCPLIQLGSLFGYGEPVDPCENLVVIVQCEGQKIALVLDELIGQQQVVIKTLGERFKSVQGVSGAAILGDGRVGVILEPTGLLALHKQRGSAAYHRPAVAKGPVTVDSDPPAPVASDVTEQGAQIDTESEEDVCDAVGAASPSSGATCPAEPVTAPA